MKWDTFRLKLDLDDEQEIIIKYLLNRLKDHFAETCEKETEDYDLSPVEFAAEMKLENPGMDEAEVEKKLVEYLWKQHVHGLDMTYVEACEKYNLVTRKEIKRLLRSEQKKIYAGFESASMLDLDTGYAPLKEMILKQIEKRKELKKRNIKIVCSIPFEYAHIENTGEVYPCCPSKFRFSIGDLNKDSLSDIWDSKAAIAVRRSILDRTFRYCDYEACEYLKPGNPGTGKDVNREAPGQTGERDLNGGGTAPKIINLAYDRTCNLACPYCRNEVHGNQKEIAESTERIHHNVFDKELPGVQRLIISGNGDPFASHLYMEFLENFDKDEYPDLKIKIQTNGLLLTPNTWEKISESHSAIDWISISVDAATEESYKLNRGGSFRKLRENLEFVSALRKSGKIDKFFVNFVVQANNFREMKQFAELGLSLGCDMIEFQCIENWGTFSPEEFREVAVQNPSHPEHENFLKILEDPIFADPSVCVNKLMEFMPASIRNKWLNQGIVIRYDAT